MKRLMTLLFRCPVPLAVLVALALPAWGANRCEITSVTPNYAPIKAYVNIKGNGLDQNCMVFIKSSPGGKKVQAYTTADTSGLKVQVPYELSPGKGTIEARPYGGQQPPGRELPFEVIPVPPVLQGLSPIGVSPGTNRIKVTGKNLEYLASSTAILELQSGEQFPLQTGNNNATQFSVMVVPDVYKGFAVTSRNAEHRKRIQQVKTLYVKRGASVSNKLGLNIRSPYPILDQVSKSVVYPGDVVIVNCGNVNQSRITSYFANFRLPNGIYQAKILPPPVPPPPVPVPYLPEMNLVGMFTVKIPDVFAGKSAAEKAAIERTPVPMTIFGPDTLNSNSLMLTFRQKGSSGTATTTTTTPAATGSEQILLTHPSAPTTRNKNYYGMNYYESLRVSTNKITRVTNTCGVAFKLWLKTNDNRTSSEVVLGPGQSTSALNGLMVGGWWEAAGPIYDPNKHTFLSIKVDWVKN